jgi:hypothetical protein
MRAFILCYLLCVSCGGRVEGELAQDSGPTEESQVVNDTGSAPTKEPPPAVLDDAAPSPDAGKAEPNDGPLVTCEGGTATGPITGCGPDKACNSSDSMTDAWAQDLLACYVDRCSLEQSGTPWCGTIALTFGSDGCTTGYREEGPGTGGCVKYQGYYRAWPCLAGQTITVTRPCP